MDNPFKLQHNEIISNNTIQHNEIIGNNTIQYKYFIINNYWTKKILPILESKEGRKILDNDFKKYVHIRRRQYVEHMRKQGSKITMKEALKNGTWKYIPGKLPIYWDSCDWRYDRKGRRPIFDEYICHSACHWIVNSLLNVALQAFPKKNWVIVTNDKHSTVWDQNETFFDLNWYGMGISAEECAKATILNPYTKKLEYGKFLHLY